MAWNPRDLEERLLIGSTLVEGSTLTEGEARDVLAGKTLQGHPVLEIRELLNYRAAVEWLISQLGVSPYLSIDLIQHFHIRLFQGFAGDHGRWKTSPNFTYRRNGTRHEYTSPSRVDDEMRAWVKNFNQALITAPDAAAARLYYQFQLTHPFADGNGRIGRVLISYWLDWKADQSFSFRLKDKAAHLEALEAGNEGNFGPLEKFFRTHVEKK